MTDELQVPAPRAPQPRLPERQLAPGVYFTPAPAARHCSLERGPRPVHELSAAELQREAAELDNSVAHLVRSNAEMRDADPDGSDADLALAQEENAEIIARRTERLRELNERIDALVAPCAPPKQTAPPRPPQRPAQGDGGLIL